MGLFYLKFYWMCKNKFQIYVRNSLYIPHLYNSIVFKKKQSNLIIFYNDFKKIKIPVNEDKSLWSFDVEGNSIVSLFDPISIIWGYTFNQINHKMFTFENIFFEKISFKGKGFKLTSKKKTRFIYFLFGHSHIKTIFLKKAKMKRLSKYKYFFKSKHKNHLKNSVKMISNIRPLNIFTKRGLRVNRQFVFKRKGKKSTYV